MPGRPDQLTMLDVGRVRLLPGSPFHARQELHRTGPLAALDPDRLLHEYRVAAGRPQAGAGGYGGWDSGFLRGHLLGHYLSAASRMAVATGDDTFRGKVEVIVAELARCQAALGAEGYLAAFPPAVFDWLEGRPVDNGGIVVPYYTVHKLLAGLLDAHRHLGVRQALEVATRMADYFAARLAALPAATVESIFRTDGSRNPQNEPGAMGEALAELYAITGERRVLEAARLFQRPWFVEPLLAGHDRLRGLHGNTHIAQALALARIANVSGDPDALRAAEAFWTLLTGSHSFATGGDSFHEWLDGPGVEAGPSIDGGAALPPTTGETCNTHHLLRLTSLLFARSPRAALADFFERALYNHVLASVAPDTGDVTYYTPMHGHFRTYLEGTFCCNGTGLENPARYGEGIAFERGDALWVNLYVPSQLTWEAAGLRLRLEGDPAAGEPVRITVVEGGGAAEATLHLRIPAWISDAPRLTVDGAVHPGPLRASSYASIRRRWRTGEALTLELPAALRLERAQDVPSLAAVFFGPLLLAGELGSEGMPPDRADRDAHLGLAPAAVPPIAAAGREPARWLRPLAGRPLAFRVHEAGPASGLTLRPLYQVHHQRYAVYWPLQA